MKDKDMIESIIEHKQLKLNGYSIHYFCTGDSTKDLIVFLHAAFVDHRCFNKQIDYFSKDFRIITIDMLGHGLSKSDKSKDKIDATINHIDTILKLEGYDKTHIVGVSMGSLIAQYYGLKYPNKVSSMTILGGYDINADNREIAKAQRSEQVKWIFKALFSMNSFRRYVAKISVSEIEEQAKFYEMSKNFTRKSFLAMSGLDKVLQKRDDIVLSYPILIMSGDKDIELAKKSSIKWHERELKSKYILIENAGHCANMDNSVIFNELLLNFIKQKQ
jgi:pimeloyl-ACP methyl ester carboxylesterase